MLCINKIDRADARIAEVLDEVYDLFIDLGADEHQLDFAVVYTNARAGIAMATPDGTAKSLKLLFDTIVDTLPGPRYDPSATTQFQVNNLDYNDYVGRLAIGRIVSGELHAAGQYTLCRADGRREAGKVTLLYAWHGLERREITQARAGDIVAVAGIADLGIGDTIADRGSAGAAAADPHRRADDRDDLRRQHLAVGGREGQLVTSRKIRERLFAEARKNVSLRIEETGQPDALRVAGRGELQLAILIETMRREGYELQVSKPTIITARRTARRSSRWSSSSSTCPRISSASSRSSSPSGRAS